MDAALYAPNPEARRPGRVTVVALSRMVYRKGIDLLIAILPVIAARHPDVDFVIGGDGPKLGALRHMVEEAGLSDRVALLGHVRPDQVRDVLVQGHIFLNCSLTEAFCMAIVEAAAAGDWAEDLRGFRTGRLRGEVNLNESMLIHRGSQSASQAFAAKFDRAPGHLNECGGRPRGLAALGASPGGTFEAGATSGQRTLQVCTW